MYYYEGNDPSNGTTAGEFVPGSPIAQQLLNERAQSIVSRYSNIGADNPAKSQYPLPRSLFYDAAKLDPDVKQAEKYGLFMFYSFGGGGGNSYLDQYYLSERSEYNRNYYNSYDKIDEELEYYEYEYNKKKEEKSKQVDEAIIIKNNSSVLLFNISSVTLITAALSYCFLAAL